MGDAKSTDISLHELAERLKRSRPMLTNAPPEPRVTSIGIIVDRLATEAKWHGRAEERADNQEARASVLEERLRLASERAEKYGDMLREQGADLERRGAKIKDLEAENAALRTRVAVIETAGKHYLYCLGSPTRRRKRALVREALAMLRDNLFGSQGTIGHVREG